MAPFKLLLQAWLAAFLTFAEKPPRRPVRWLLWLLAPVLIALDLCYGIILFDHHTCKKRSSLLNVLPLTLVSCAIGAAIAFQFGPMFIGMGTLALGGIAVLFREIRLVRQNGAAT